MEKAKLLYAILETAPDGIMTIDRNGVIERMNPSAFQLFGYQEDELIGLNISVLVAEADQSRRNGSLIPGQHPDGEKTTRQGSLLQGIKKDGSRFPMRFALSEVKSAESIIYTGFIQDLTPMTENGHLFSSHDGELEKLVEERTGTLKQMLAELEAAKEEADSSLEKEKELNRLKSRFVSMAAHEFRTPLSAIQLSAVLIEKYLEVSDQVNTVKHLHQIKNAIGSLNTILNDFLSLDQLEIGLVKPAYHPFDLVRFAEELTEEMQLLTRDDQIIIYQHTGSESQINLDQNLLRHCLINLISNAVKYSGEDTLIEFSTEINDEHYLFTVKDNGIGIPEKDQTSIFQPFFRAQNTGKIRGTGLGLYIVEKYVNLMNGKIHFESTSDHGTQFILSFIKTHDEN